MLPRRTIVRQIPDKPPALPNGPTGPEFSAVQGAVGRVDPGLAGSPDRRLGWTAAGAPELLPESTNVAAHGAVGDGSHNDTAAIQAACDSGAAMVILPQTSWRYVIDEPIEPLQGQVIMGQGGYRAGVTGAMPVQIAGPFDGPNILLPSGGDVTLANLYLGGHGGDGDLTDIAIEGVATSHACSIHNVRMQHFGGPAIKVAGGTAWDIGRCMSGDVLLAYGDLVAAMGALDIAGTDHYVHHNEWGANGGAYDAGLSAAVVVRDGGSFYSDNVGELSETGWIILDAAAGCSFVGNRADLNKGHGWMVDGAYHSFTSNKSHSNGLAAHNTYDAWHVNAWCSTFVANTVQQGDDANKMRYGFYDFSDAPGIESAELNVYIGNVFRNIPASGRYNMSTGSRWLDFGRTLPTVSGSKGSNAALESLIDALVAQGLIADSTS